MLFDYYCIIRLEHVDMLSFLHYILNFGFSDLDYEIECNKQVSMLHFTFAFKKDLIWFNNSLIKLPFFYGKFIVWINQNISR